MFDAFSIRPIEEADLILLLEWRNHPMVRSVMLTQHSISEIEHRRWFASAQEQGRTKDMLMVFEGSQPIGFVQFTLTNLAGVSNWGFYTAPNSSKGTGSKLGHAALNHAFNNRGFQKVCGQAIDSNYASIKFHQKLGFKEEGRLREHNRIGHGWVDLLCFGLTATEWVPKLEINLSK